MKVSGVSQGFFRIFVLVLILGAHSTRANAESQFTPILGVEANFLDIKEFDGDESGTVSVISVGFNHLLTSPGINLSIDYAVDSENYSNLDREDRDLPRLDLNAVLNHEPGRWKTEVFSTIKQANDDIDGIQSIRDDLFNEDTRELRTMDVSTEFNGRWTSELQYKSRIGVDAADFEDEDETQGASLGFSVDNNRSGKAFTWASALNSQVAEEGGNEEQIDVLALNLNYRFSTRWQAFTDLTAWETDEDQLSQDSFLVGVAWNPTTNTTVRFGAGDLESNETYSLDAQITQRRIQFTAKYTEGITSARAETLNELREDLLSTLITESTSIDPVLQQRADVGFTLEGIRSMFGINLFDYKRDPIVSGDKEKGSGIAMNFSRRLPRQATAGIDILGERTELTETSDLYEIEVYYRKIQTKNIELIINLNFSEQDSSLSENDYEQTRLGIAMLITW